MVFQYELLADDAIRQHIRDCEGRHVQQVVFSTYMDVLTQICFTEQKIRGSIAWEGNKSWKPVEAPQNTTGIVVPGTTGGGQ